MANIYELRNRDLKITRLVDALDADLQHPATVADLSALSNDGERLNRILAAAKVRNASQETVDALVARIQQRDAKFQEVAQ